MMRKMSQISQVVELEEHMQKHLVLLKSVNEKEQVLQFKIILH